MRVRRAAEDFAPRRRDEPLRDVNISDNEVREILHVVRDYLPEAIVNIGPVVTGCPCEEGKACTEQVYIQANTDNASMGLMLSRVAKNWDISRAQKWWLRWQSLQQQRAKLGFEALREREWELAREFPGCMTGDSSPAKISATSSAEPRK
jgi:hypothetical protein